MEKGSFSFACISDETACEIVNQAMRPPDAVVPLAFGNDTSDLAVAVSMSFFARASNRREKSYSSGL